MAMTKQQLLVEIEDIIRSMPPRETIRHEKPENFVWLGRLSAAIEQWAPIKAAALSKHMAQFQNPMAREAAEAFRNILVLLHQAQNDLRMETVGPLNVAIPNGMVFAYFDELRKIIELAKQDLLFVDPYLEADCVSRYLGFVCTGVTIRLLARERLSTLLPAVDLLSRQSSLSISVRSAPGFHDRYVFVDGAMCYQSGASFKDGAKSAPTIITQITDAFPAMKQTYEDLWSSAKVER